MNDKEHLLICIAEESSEIAESATRVSKAATKALRFGLEDVNFLEPDGPNNTQRLVDELNDLLGVVQMLVKRGLIPQDWCSTEKMAAKQKKVTECMEYARGVGALSRINPK